MARLPRDKLALGSGLVFLLVVVACAAAPLWAKHVAHTTPERNHLTDTVVVDGERVDVVALDGVPIGPTWQSRFFLGADENGRDVMVRLLYGGRNSLLIGFGAALITTILAVMLGVAAGLRRGWTDGVISRALEILWAFPVILLAIALGAALAQDGIKVGPLPAIEGGSLLIPVLVISIVFVPYLARPIRGEVLSLREREFVLAAVGAGMGPWRLMRSEILPNLAQTVLTFFPLLVANAILLEAAISFLGAGVQAPTPSWGTMIADGIERLATAPALAIAPGAILVLTVLALNLFVDGIPGTRRAPLYPAVVSGARE